MTGLIAVAEKDWSGLASRRMAIHGDRDSQVGPEILGGEVAGGVSEFQVPDPGEAIAEGSRHRPAVSQRSHCLRREADAIARAFGPEPGPRGGDLPHGVVGAEAEPVTEPYPPDRGWIVGRAERVRVRTHAEAHVRILARGQELLEAE